MFGRPGFNSREMRRFREEDSLSCFFWRPSACSPASTKPAAPPPAPPPPPAADADAGIRSRVEPDVIEETDTYVDSSASKKDVHPRRRPPHPASRSSASRSSSSRKTTNYYYVYTPKRSPRKRRPKRQLAEQQAAPPGTAPCRDGRNARARACRSRLRRSRSRRASGARIQLRAGRQDRACRTGGMWRASFVIADMNGDGIPDIVAPPRGSGDAQAPHLDRRRQGQILATGRSLSSRTESPRHASRSTTAASPSAISTATASSTSSCVPQRRPRRALRRRQGGFRVVRDGLPGREILVAGRRARWTSTATGSSTSSRRADIHDGDARRRQADQVRVYLNRGSAASSSRRTGSDRRRLLELAHRLGLRRRRPQDVLTGSHFTGALTLLWKNGGNGKFRAGAVPGDRDPTGTTSRWRRAPSARARFPRSPTPITRWRNVPEVTARIGCHGVLLPRTAPGTRHRVWRKKDGLTAHVRRSRWGTSTATGWTTSSSPTRRAGSSGSSSRSRTAASPRSTRSRSRLESRRTVHPAGGPRRRRTARLRPLARR